VTTDSESKVWLSYELQTGWSENQKIRTSTIFISLCSVLPAMSGPVSGSSGGMSFNPLSSYLKLTYVFYLKPPLQLPDDFNSLKLNEEDRKYLVTAFEDYNKLHQISLDLERSHPEMVVHSVAYNINLITVREQLQEARSCIVSVINFARAERAAASYDDRTYFSLHSLTTGWL